MKLEAYKGLKLAELTDKEVLFFIRIHGKRGIFGQFYPNNLLDSFEQLREYRTISEYNVADVLIDLNSQKLEDITATDHTLFDKYLNIEEIIVRCRGLREISYKESRQLIWRAAKFFLDYYREHNELKLIVSLIVDNYVLDVMTRLAPHFNVEVMQVIGFFVPGYIRFTVNGHGVSVRDVPEAELEKVYQRLTNRTPSHMAINKSKAIKNITRDYVSFHYRYLLRYLWAYKVQGKLAYEYRFCTLSKRFS